MLHPAYAEDPRERDHDMRVVHKVFDSIGSCDFETASRTLEMLDSASVTNTLESLIRFEQCKMRFKKNGGFSNQRQTQQLLKEGKEFEKNIRSALDGNEKDFTTCYVVAMAGTAYLSVAQQYLSYNDVFIVEGKPGRPEEEVRADSDRTTSIYALVLVSVQHCLRIDNQDPDSLLLFGLLCIQAKSFDGFLAIELGLRLFPKNHFSLLYAAEKWEHPGLIGSKNLRGQLAIALCRVPQTARRVIKLAKQKHFVEFELLKKRVAEAKQDGCHLEVMDEILEMSFNALHFCIHLEEQLKSR
ncbi:hypothetical protein Poly51_42540 [Rubripirellula tenax]|uniref:Uncharacterized protein n=2 Tax=Rubripirellula tenax TaxID=2528015 RepID=A0A5C6EUC0_9BACT|nr:hypothetical protein Poly51_42540 [Rubripirellula tenax]